MAGGKLSPRQKMINMMYLVLTALLAMNVSKEILNSFALLNNGLEATNKNFTAKNLYIYDRFDQARRDDPKKVQDYWTKANSVRNRSKQMYDYIDSLKVQLIRAVEKKDFVEIKTETGKDTMIRIVSDVLHMEAKDDNAVPTNFFMGDKDKAEQGNKAYDFKDMITKYKADLMTQVPKELKAGIKLGLNTEDIYSEHEGMKITWESNNFYHNPAVAVVALLTKMQNDVKNAETDIITALYNRIDANTFKFDKLEGRVNAESNYVLLGDDYQAEIFVAGFSTTSNPQIWLGKVDSITHKIVGPVDSTSVKVIDGVGHLTQTPTSEGTQEYQGIIRVKNPADPDGPRKEFSFSSSYKSAKPAIVVSPDKMNVFYIGVENPVSISVPGVAPSDLRPSLSGGSMSGSNGKYNVRVSGGTKATVNVSANTRTGSQSMGKGIEFRVKQVPNPEAEFMGKRGTATISEVQLKGGQMLLAKLDNFAFDLNFPVVSYNVSITVNGKVVDAGCNGATLSSSAKQLISNAKRGMKVYFDSVKIKKPDGKTYDIGGVTLKVI